MTDQQQRTQRAIDMLDGFVGDWTPPIVQAQANSPVTAAAERVKRAIRGIAPRGDIEVMGWAVFRREIDADWDQRQRPSGYVHIICEIRERP